MAALWLVTYAVFVLVNLGIIYWLAGRPEHPSRQSDWQKERTR